MSSRLNYTPFFTPTQISGCQLWLDAADRATTIMSDSNVLIWRDKSSAANHFQSAGPSTSPTTSNYNGNQIIYWTNTNQQLVSSKNNATTGNTSRTIFCLIFSPLTTSQFYAVTGTEAGGNPATAFGFGKNPNADYVYPFLYSSIGSDVYTFVQITAVPTILTMSFNGSAISGWINNASAITNSTSLNTTAGVWYLGKRQQNGTGSQNSYLFELIQYDSALSVAQRQQVEGYLAQKWGFPAVFSDSHPAKTTPLYRNPAALVNRTMIPYHTAFRPTQIQGCALWLDAADSSSLVLSGNSITQWRDKSGSGNHMNQYSSATAPTRSSIGNMNTVYFNTADPTSVQGTPPFTNVQVLQGTNFQTTADSTIFLVVYPLYTATSTKFIVNLKSRAPAAWANLYDINLGTGDGTNAGGFGSFIRTDTSFVGADANFYTNNTMNLTSCSISNTAVSFHKNGSLYRSGTVLLPMPTSDAYQVFTLGAYLNIDTYDTTAKMGARAHFCEVIVYNGSLSTAQRQQVESYLAQKWGMRTSLPAGHIDITQPAGIPQGVPAKKTQMSYTSPFNTTVVFTYTGGNQTFTVPANITRIQVIMWGAGGSGGSSAGSFGGAGAFLQGTLVVTPGQALTIMVGQAGTPVTANFAGTAATYGGGGGTKAGDGYTLQTGSGGGMSAIRNGATYLAIAGGGGGSGIFGAGGAGSSRGNGANGTSPVSLATFGTGGTAAGAGGIAQNGDLGSGGLYQGTNGAAYQGGTGGAYGGGGGGGYGGGGGGSANGGSAGGGGGGSSFSSNLTNVTAIDSTNGILAPNSTSPFYDAGVAVGGTAQGGSAAAQRGGNGRVVIRY